MTSQNSLDQDKSALRKIGYELEFSGIALEEAAGIIQSLFGGTVSKIHRYRYEVTDTHFGTFRAELDAQNMRRMAHENAFKEWGIDFDSETQTNSIEDMVDRLAQSVVPLEIVMPPVPLNEIDKLEELREALQKNKAEGTKTSLIHAFGMHINIECPDLEAETLLRYLRAFMIMYPWLGRQLKIDVARKITPYVDRFPVKYVRLVLNPDYEPDMQALVNDYLIHNPTRNRPLDMMPIWALDYAAEVEKVLKDEKNAPRPTFHYRMPNSYIDDPSWRLRTELDYWLQVEALAEHPKMINRLSRLYLLQKDRILTPFENHWAETLTILLNLDA